THEMPVYFIDHFGKEHRRVLPFRRRGEVGAEKENLIHANVESIGAEAVDDFVHQLEDDSRYVRIQRIPFAAIDAFVAGKRSGCGIERRTDGKEGERFALPRLVAKRLKLRDQPDAKFPALRGKLARSFSRDRIVSPAQHWIRLEIKAVVNLENHHID